jgi:hypothetical protein
VTQIHEQVTENFSLAACSKRSQRRSARKIDSSAPHMRG